MKCMFASIKVVNKTVHPMQKFTKINKIILSPFAFLLWRMLGTVELTGKPQAWDLDCCVLPGCARTVTARRMFVLLLQMLLSFWVIRKQTVLEWQTKKGLKEHITGKFSLFFLIWELKQAVVHCDMCLSNSFLMKTEYSCGRTEWLPEPCGHGSQTQRFFYLT